METQLLASIARKDGSTPNDAKFKELLAYREVLPHYEDLRNGVQGLYNP